jgi:hypothetical protein
LASWKRFFTAEILDFCANSCAETYVNASSGHHFTHCGSFSSLQASQVKTTFLSGCIIMAPNWHALMHQAQPLQAFSSTVITPVRSSWLRASRGHAATHAGSSQCLQVTDKLVNGPRRSARIRDLVGLKVFSCVTEQAYSQTKQPMHFSGSAVTNFLSCGRTMLSASLYSRCSDRCGFCGFCFLSERYQIVKPEFLQLRWGRNAVCRPAP